MPLARNVKKRNQGSEGRAIAKQQEIKLDRTEARRKAEIAKRRQIRFTREYRQGEVPDVEITYGEIVKKLQDIVLLDSGVARLAVGSMVTSWADNADISKVLRDENVKSRLENSLDALFEAVTDQTSSDMLETLLHVASAADVHIKPQHIVDASKKTNSFFIGIQALERQVTLEQPEEQRKEKRTRNKGPGGRESAKQQILNPKFSNSNWAALADLYAALEENDIALGLSSKFTKFEETQDALELELQGRQLEALEKWSSVLKEDILETEGQSWPEHTISGLIIESAISQRC
jgi:DNA-dependent protein kinase catalytic subunit